MFLVAWILALFSCQKEPIPVVFEEVEVSNITETTAIFRISIKEINVGHYNQGIVFSKFPNPTIQDGREGEFFSDPFDVTVGVSGLEPGTLYYMKAYIETSSGVFYGDSFSMRTLAPTWFIDNRDGQKYMIRSYGSFTWMIENLNFRTKDSRYYMNDSITYANDFGRLYLYEEAAAACPPGWRLPTPSDWDHLFSFCGESDERIFSSILEPGIRLWKKNHEISIDNSKGFTIRPAGFLSTSEGHETFSEKGYTSVLWSRSEDNLSTKLNVYSTNDTRVFQKNLNLTQQDIYYSVRCIKE